LFDTRAIKDGVNESRSAQIFDKGLPHPDEYQTHALDTVAAWGMQVSRDYCQEYAERRYDRIRHIRGHHYSPPGPGWVCIAPAHHPGLAQPEHEGLPIPQLRAERYELVSPETWECHIDRVIKIGIKNEQVNFDDPVLYHGLPTCPGSPLVSSNWKGGLDPPVLLATNGFHGKGLYTTPTPSFRMAASYAYRSCKNGDQRFATGGPASSNYMAVLMLAVPPDEIGTKAKGTAFSHNTDGWDRTELEWVVPNAERAQVFGVLMCYFQTRPKASGDNFNVINALPTGKKWCWFSHAVGYNRRTTSLEGL